MFNWQHMLALGLFLAALTPLTAQQGDDDINDQHQNTIKAAARKVAPSVVQIATQGGGDVVVMDPKKGVVFRKAMGPTTGVIVSADGYIISSAFNFVNNPPNISVIIPGEEAPVFAKRIATDRSRMLTLLKVDRKNLPVPALVPKKDLKVGQWAIALGRSLDMKVKQGTPPSISLGIISALNRIWGKAVQTDAKVSPVNYGGPLIDIQGRVQGILIPASQRKEGETAGFEWYDSGIGFAVPMEDVIAMLPRLKEGKDLQKGELGITLKNQDDEIGAIPVVAMVQPGSAAERGGLKVGDTLVEVDGKAVVNLSQIRHIIGTKYEGDGVALKVKRGKNELALAFDLVSSQTTYERPYLGILPVRDDPDLGVLVRFVYPNSPAAKAGLKEGDRIVKAALGGKPLAGFTGEKRGREQLMDWLSAGSPGAEIKLEVRRQGGNKTATLTTRLERTPGTTRTHEEVVPEKLPELATLKKALMPLQTSGPNIKPLKVETFAKNVKKGFVKRTNAAGNHPYWMHVPENYDPNISYGLVVVLHQPGKYTDAGNEKIADAWEDYCKENNLIVIGPKSEADAGWVPSEMDIVTSTVRDVQSIYNIDRQRIVAHGMGVGGQMAIYLGFNARDLFHGVATTGAVVIEPGNNLPTQRLAFFLACGDRDPILRAVRESLERLHDRRLPVWYHELPNRGREYLDEPTFVKMVQWIETLDRM